MHFINPIPTLSAYRSNSPPISFYIIDSTEEDSQDLRDAPEVQNKNPIISYSEVPRTDKSKALDERLPIVKEWLTTLKRPESLSNNEYKTFMRFATAFVEFNGSLWRKHPQGFHRAIIDQDRRLFIISMAHDDIGHRGFYATNSLLIERYWWPGMSQDVAWYIKTCHLCQLRQTQQIAIPPVVALPAPLFAKVYMDTMHLTTSGGFKYIVQARCSLTHWPEWEMLRKETAKSIATFILRNIIYRWGTLVEIVTDNGAPFVKALTYLAKQYHITHIRISGYNSRANGLVVYPLAHQPQRPNHHHHRSRAPHRSLHSLHLSLRSSTSSPLSFLVPDYSNRHTKNTYAYSFCKPHNVLENQDPVIPGKGFGARDNENTAEIYYMMIQENKGALTCGVFMTWTSTSFN